MKGGRGGGTAGCVDSWDLTCVCSPLPCTANCGPPFHFYPPPTYGSIGRCRLPPHGKSTWTLFTITVLNIVLLTPCLSATFSCVDFMPFTTGIYKVHGQATDQHGQATDQHGQATDQHGQATDQHGQATDQHGQATDQHGQATDQHGQATDQHGQATDQHTPLTAEVAGLSTGYLKQWIMFH